MMKMIPELTKSMKESEQQYRMRCYQYKQTHPELTWEELAYTMNRETGRCNQSDTYRKQSKVWLASIVCVEDSNEEVDDHAEATSDNDTLEDMHAILHEIKKARVKLSDELTQNRAYIRRLSREETLLEMARVVASEMSEKKQLPVYKQDVNTAPSASKPREGILCLSDWHYGMEVNNYFNNYSPEVCKERLGRLRDEVIEKGRELNFTKLHVVNLSDLISGRIHSQIRIANRFDVITQIMQVSELLAELLTDLSDKFEIEYRDCLDNHSRLEPNKKESLDLESLARLIPWYLAVRLKDNAKIKLLYNNYADDIIDFNVFGFNVVAVHGHKDTPGKIINNMIAATRRRNDLVMSAHFHHFSADEEHECMRVSNGTLMGVDTNAQDLRLTSKASQNLIVATPTNVTEFICKINV